MEKSHSKTPYIIAIAIISVIALILATVVYTENRRANMGERALETTYMRSLNELSGYVTNIANTLEKVQYVGTAGQMQILSSKLTKDSAAAKTALTAIPTTNELDLSSINKFLSQTGNYSSSLAKKLEYGEKLTDEEYNNVVSLKKHAENLQNSIYRLGEDIASGNLSINQFYTVNSEATGDDEPIEDNGEQGESISRTKNDLQNQVREMEEGFVSYPSLIYDGPFSDHLLSRNPSLTKEAPVITQAQAQTIAAGAAQTEKGNMNFVQMENSYMPAYCFNGNGCSVAITEKGGYIAYMIKDSSPAETNLSIDEAFEAAGKYIEDLGITSMKNSYYEIKNNICTLNFAYNLKGVTCYTDLVKVDVAMDSGEIVGFDARGYIMNHHERTITEPLISEEKARESVSPKLKILSVSRAIIPTAGKNEIPTYEFKTKSESGETVLVYINSNNGIEEQILILVDNENGVLTV